jgi:hypothetical protein
VQGWNTTDDGNGAMAMVAALLILGMKTGRDDWELCS